jgi:Fe2+ or Zn2+ uptake regulation protein
VAELDAPEIFERIAEKAKARKFSAAHTMIEISGTCGSCARAA